jgi:hypothetical protein
MGCSPAISQSDELYPGSSIKEEVKKKQHTPGWNFSCFAAPFNEQDLF